MEELIAQNYGEIISGERAAGCVNPDGSEPNPRCCAICLSTGNRCKKTGKFHSGYGVYYCDIHKKYCLYSKQWKEIHQYDMYLQRILKLMLDNRNNDQWVLQRAFDKFVRDTTVGDLVNVDIACSYVLQLRRERGNVCYSEECTDSGHATQLAHDLFETATGVTLPSSLTRLRKIMDDYESKTHNLYIDKLIYGLREYQENLGYLKAKPTKAIKAKGKGKPKAKGKAKYAVKAR